MEAATSVPRPQPLRVLLRAWPNSEAAREAVLRAGADALILDATDQARRWTEAAAIAAALRRDARRPALYVAIPGLSAGLADMQLDEIMPAEPDAILLAGAVGHVDVEHLGAKLAVREALLGLAAGRTRVMIAVDTASGVLALRALPTAASPRLAAVVFDPGRLAESLGCDPGSAAIEHASATAILFAAASGVPALYAASSRDHADLEGIRLQGFAGVLLDCPDRVAEARGVFDRLRPAWGASS